jgi:predicted GTPase
VISATPTDINRILKANKSIIRINYELSPVNAALDLRLDCFAREHSGK